MLGENKKKNQNLYFPKKIKVFDDDICVFFAKT